MPVQLGLVGGSNKAQDCYSSTGITGASVVTSSLPAAGVHTFLDHLKPPRAEPQQDEGSHHFEQQQWNV